MVCRYSRGQGFDQHGTERLYLRGRNLGGMLKRSDRTNHHTGAKTHHGQPGGPARVGENQHGTALCALRQAESMAQKSISRRLTLRGQKLVDMVDAVDALG